MIYNFPAKDNYDAIRIMNKIKNGKRNNNINGVKTRGKFILIDISNVDDNIITYLKKHIK